MSKASTPGGIFRPITKNEKGIVPSISKQETAKENIKIDIKNTEKIIEKKDEKIINVNDILGLKRNEKKNDLDCIIIKDITLSNDVHMRLLSNINGYFIDIRKYFRGQPSQKGIRISATRFSIGFEYLKRDIEALNLQYPEKEAIRAMISK